MAFVAHRRGPELNLATLAESLIRQVFAFLPVHELVKAGGSCRCLANCAEDDSLWQRACVGKWPSAMGLVLQGSSFKAFFKRRKGRTAVQDLPRGSLADYRLLVDLKTRSAVCLYSAAISLEEMADGRISSPASRCQWSKLQFMHDGLNDIASRVCDT